MEEIKLSDKNCIFCIMPSTEVRRTVYTSDLSRAILSKYPIQKGHLLVIPFDHHIDILVAPEKVAMDVFHTMRLVGIHTNDSLRPPGMVMGANIGVAGSVKHLHWHVSPIFTLADPKLHGHRVEVDETTIQEYLQLFKSIGKKNSKPAAAGAHNQRNCMICQMPQSEIARVVYEDKICRVIEPKNRIEKGHLIVMSKDHYSDLLNAPYSVAFHTYDVMRRMATNAQAQLECAGMAVGTTMGIASAIGHLHWHILPMYSAQYPQLQRDAGSKLNEAFAHEMTELLRY